MPTIQERVSAAMRFFFEEALPQASGKNFGQLASPLVHTGAYVTHDGQPVQTAFGQDVTPAFVLRVHSALAVANGLPQAPSVPAPSTGGVPRHLLSLRQVADLKADTEEEIRRVMADVESFAPIFNAPGPTAAPIVASGALDQPSADGSTEPAPPPAPAAPAPEAVSNAALHASEWAKALVAARDAIGDDLAALASVPAPLTALAPDVNALKTVLLHFFTFDAAGRRYARWAGAGRDGTNGTHLTPEYKRENVRELQLEREHVYLYGIVPEGLLAPGAGLDASAFREFVVRFDDTGEADRPFSLATLHTARWRRNAAPHEDFVFFHAEAGTGPAVAWDLRAKMAPSLLTLLRALAAPGADTEAVLDASPFAVKQGDAWYIVLSVLFEGAVQVPDGVLADDTTGWGIVQAPPDRIVALAALPGVKHLDPVKPAEPSLDLLRPEVNYVGLEGKVAAGKRGGQGVLVGIIDTGIDGSHPAFAGRIHSVWDQDDPPLVTGKSPKANNTGNDAYKLMDFGVELTKTSSPQTVADSKDSNGHGTHVAGIAAGAEVKDAAGAVLVSAGLAPNATIVAVRAIENTKRSNWLLGVAYIFNKARELGLPCVINMSFGHHDHAHDGSDPGALALFRLVTDANKRYLPGRIVVAAAGNDRRLANGTAKHVKRRLPSKVDFDGVKVATAVDLGTNLDTAQGEVLRGEKLIGWIKNPVAGSTATLPLDFYVYRRTGASTFDVARKVRIGDSSETSFSTLNTRIRISSQLADAVNGDYSFEVVFEPIDKAKPIATPTRWHVLFINATMHELDVDFWLLSGKSSFADFAESDRAYLVGAPATSAAAISVASSNTRLNWQDAAGKNWSSPGAVLHEISTFSSMGPLREASRPVKTQHGVSHDVAGVDVTAPGFRIIAARSAQRVIPPKNAFTIINERALLLQGTSMASPAVAGLVANLLAEEPALTIGSVLDRLKAASSIPATSAFQPPPAAGGARPFSEHWGYGLVDAAKLKP